MMKELNRAIDALLYRIGHGITRFRYIILLLMAAFMAMLLVNVPKITMDTTTEGFLHENDPMRIQYNHFREQFGRDEKIVVAVQTDGVFEFKTLEKLKNLHTELKESVPYLNDITSLINARNTRGDGDNLIVEDLFETWPDTQEALDQKEATALANPLYKNLLISEDGTFTLIVLESNTYTSLGAPEEDLFAGFDETASEEKREFISDEENSEMVTKVREITDRYRGDGFEIYLAGSPSVTDGLKRSMKKDIAIFNLLIILTVLVILSLLFRRVSGVVLPMATVILAVLSTVGLMAYYGTPIKTPTQIIPSFLLAVGISTSIHVLAIFFHHFDKYGDKYEAIAHTLKHSGFAIVMTSLTTAAGLASFSFSEVAPIADLGIYASLGVLITLLYSLILLPVLLAIFPLKRKAHPHEEHQDRMERVLTAIARFSQERARSIVAVASVIIISSVALAFMLEFSHNPLKWFKKDHETRIATETIDKAMRGTISLELVIDTHKENGLYDYDVLKSLEEMTRFMETIDTEQYFVGKAISVADVIKEIHRALNENRADYYQIPQNEQLIAQEILLFENSGSDDLEDFVDSQFSKARITVKVPWIDAVEYHDLLATIHAKLEKTLPAGIEVTTTGMIPLLGATTTAAIHSSAVSYLIAFGAITLMMIFMLSSFKLGLLSMIPNLLPVFVTIGIMVLFDFPFDLFTMLIGSIVIGLAVDDTVHFMHNFQRYRHQGHETAEAVRLTLTGTGRAMLVSSIVLSLGFFVYLFASMGNLINFGLLTGLAIIVALLADFLLAPAMMALLYKKGNRDETD